MSFTPANNPVKETKPAKKAAPKTNRISKSQKLPNQAPKRGQPTAAARLIGSSYIKFGWHKTLSSQTKDVITKVAPIADSMYMLQMDLTRPIDSMSLRNGLYWEHRQLLAPAVLSTPGIDHLDLFPTDDEDFNQTLKRMAKRPTPEGRLGLHYFFGSLRSREFLIMPVLIEDVWITIIARFAPKAELDPYQPVTEKDYIDMVYTDIAIVDPLVEGRAERRTLILNRLQGLLAEGLIECSIRNKIRDFAVPDISNDGSKSCTWQTGLVAFAISREFIRRLKVLQFRQRAGGHVCTEFLWAPFEEEYNFSNYRQALLSACAHQCIEGSGYKVRVGLEVPSDNCNYDPALLGANDTDILAGDEKWNVFEMNTHTYIVGDEKWNDASQDATSESRTSYTSSSMSSFSAVESSSSPVVDIGSTVPAVLMKDPAYTEGSMHSQAAETHSLSPELSPRQCSQPNSGYCAPNSTVGCAGSTSSSRKRSFDDEYDDDEVREVPSPKRVKAESVADEDA